MNVSTNQASNSVCVEEGFNKDTEDGTLNHNINPWVDSPFRYLQRHSECPKRNK